MPKPNQLSITFICGCLEPGKDGVGDYTRRLGAELISHGSRISLIAFNDYFIPTVTEDEQSVEHITVPCLRIPASLKKEHKLQAAHQWISKYDPQWLSLQYVAFSFQAKGLPIGLSKSLYSLGKNRKWHIMFHELYLGMEHEAPFKFLPWGYVQKYIIKEMVKRLEPKIIHTHSGVYSRSLSKFTDHTIGHLPLFGNIPVVTDTQSALHQEKLVLLLFGWIHQQAPLASFLKEILIYRNAFKKEVILQLIGKADSEKQRWIKAFEKAALEVHDFGEQGPKRISEVLSGATFGLTTTPYPLVEKSGTVAAMIEHNLPVICVAKPWTPRGIDTYEIAIPVQEYQPGRLAAILRKEYKLEHLPSVKATARKMVTDLVANSEH